MKLAVIWSSPNTDGLTASAKEKLINGAKKAGAEVTEIHLNRKSIAHCAACGNGWGTCRSSGECVIKDGFQEVYKTLQEADGIVIVTAVYWHDMTEQIKAFTDRLRRCETGHNGFLSGKPVFLATCAGGTGRGAIECLHNMEEMVCHMGMAVRDRVPVVRFNKEYMLPALETAGEQFAKRGLDWK